MRVAGFSALFGLQGLGGNEYVQGSAGGESDRVQQGVNVYRV